MRREAINSNSFLRVYDESSVIALPMTALRDPSRVSPALIFVPGESLSFYISSSVAGGLTLTDGSGTSYSMGGTTAVPTTIGGHSILNIAGVPSIPDGVYKGSIGGKEANYVEVINNIEEAAEKSVFVRCSHKKVLARFYYPYAGVSYMQRFRIRATLSERQPDINIDMYEETNTGKTRNLQGVYREYITLRLPEYTQEDHMAVSLMALHDNIIINERPYARRPAGAPRNTMDGMMMGWDGEVSFFDQSATYLMRS